MINVLSRFLVTTLPSGYVVVVEPSGLTTVFGYGLGSGSTTTGGTGSVSFFTGSVSFFTGSVSFLAGYVSFLAGSVSFFAGSVSLTGVIGSTGFGTSLGFT